jgi:hypothetical protein
LLAYFLDSESEREVPHGLRLRLGEGQGHRQSLP